MASTWVGVFGIMIVAFAAVCPLLFSRKQEAYSAIQHTLSELGAKGGKYEQFVAYGYFLPLGIAIGVYMVAVIYYVMPNASWGERSLLPLSLFGWVSVGYIIAAFFPCDQGAPIKGSASNQIHNVAGVLEYLGSGTGFMLLGLSLGGVAGVSGLTPYLMASGALILFLLPLLLLPAIYSVRGLLQRIAELVFFGWMLFFSVYLL